MGNLETRAHPIDGTLDRAQQTSLILAGLDTAGTLARPVRPLKPSDQDPTVLDLPIKGGLLGLFPHSLDGRSLTSRIFSSTLGLVLVVLGLALGVDGGSVARGRGRLGIRVMITQWGFLPLLTHRSLIGSWRWQLVYGRRARPTVSKTKGQV